MPSTDSHTAIRRHARPSLAAALWLSAALLAMPRAWAQDETNAAELAQELANPIASLISLPFQFNWDNDIGPLDNGERLTLNVQPVIPFELNDDWNLISRTIVPIIDQENIFPGAGDQFGLGDTVQSLFFSPREAAGGWTWGVGPVFLIPTATDDLLGTEKWGAGPTGVALKQTGPWTYGALFNHIWSFAGESDRADINNTFIQPFLAYNTPNAWTFTLQSESTYNWETEEWNAPAAFIVSKLVTFGKQPVSFSAGPRYYLADTEGGPEGWGFRFVATLLFPR